MPVANVESERHSKVVWWLCNAVLGAVLAGVVMGFVGPTVLAIGYAVGLVAGSAITAVEVPVAKVMRRHLREAVPTLIWLAGAEVLIFVVAERRPLMVWTVVWTVVNIAGYWLYLRHHNAASEQAPDDTPQGQ